MTDDTDIKGRAKRFKALIKEAEEELGIRTTAARQHYASLVLAREAFLAAQINGENPDPAILIALDDKIAPMLPKVRPEDQRTIRFEYVETLIGICPHCKQECPDYRAPPPRSYPSVIDLQAAPATAAALPPPSDPSHSPPEARTARKAVKPQIDEPRPPRSIHDGAPLARHDEPWRKHTPGLVW